MAERPDATPLLGSIDCPSLVIVGQQDVISPPEEMRAIARAIPHARLLEIAGSGHMTPLENPGEVTAALREFLAGL
jgi:3-oxoadipate enol-lactonase